MGADARARREQVHERPSLSLREEEALAGALTHAARCMHGRRTGTQGGEHHGGAGGTAGIST